MATRGMLVRRLDRRSLFLCTRSSCPCCTSGSPSPVHTSGTRPPVCVFSGGGVLADQRCPIARLCAPCVCEGVCAQCTATIRTKRARWFPGKEGHVRGGDPGRAPRPSRLHRGAVGSAMPIRFHMALAPCPPPGNARSVPARGDRLTGAQPVVVQGHPHRRRLPAGPSCPRATAQRWARCQWVSTRPAPATVPGRHGGQGDAAGSSSMALQNSVAHVGFQGRRLEDGVSFPHPISQSLTGVQ